MHHVLVTVVMADLRCATALRSAHACLHMTAICMAGGWCQPNPHHHELMLLCCRGQQSCIHKAGSYITWLVLVQGEFCEGILFGYACMSEAAGSDKLVCSAAVYPPL